MKKVTSLLLALVLMFSLCLPAMATDADYAASIATAMYKAGLFNGVGKDEQGNPIFALDRTATRAEGVTMLVRLMGKAEEAAQNTYGTPFADVPAWAAPTVGYAYTNKLTSGTSATTFGPDATMSAVQYMTLILRALGYSNEDFTWDKSYLLAEELGIIGPNEWRGNETFTRGDMVIISYKALWTNKKASDASLISSLGLAGALPENIAPESDLTDNTVGTVTVDAGNSNNLLPDGNGNYGLPLENLSDGTIISRDDLVYTTGASTNDNLSNFTTVLAEINPNLSWTGKAIQYGGSNLTYITAANGVWNIRINNWGTSMDCRNMFVTSLAYFGNKSMASSVYGMLDEHYRFRSDSSVPITKELASKYGLTISSEKIGESNDVTISVTNGSSTWTVRYFTADSEQANVLIPIDEIASLAAAA